jgi:hypothetical protein
MEGWREGGRGGREGSKHVVVCDPIVTGILCLVGFIILSCGIPCLVISSSPSLFFHHLVGSKQYTRRVPTKLLARLGAVRVGSCCAEAMEKHLLARLGAARLALQHKSERLRALISKSQRNAVVELIGRDVGLVGMRAEGRAKILDLAQDQLISGARPWQCRVERLVTYGPLAWM